MMNDWSNYQNQQNNQTGWSKEDQLRRDYENFLAQKPYKNLHPLERDYEHFVDQRSRQLPQTQKLDLQKLRQNYNKNYPYHSELAPRPQSFASNKQGPRTFRSNFIQFDSNQNQNFFNSKPVSNNLQEKLSTLKSKSVKGKKRRKLVPVIIGAIVLGLVLLSGGLFVNIIKQQEQQKVLASVDKNIQLFEQNKQATIETLKRLETSPEKIGQNQQSLILDTLILKNQQAMEAIDKSGSEEFVNLANQIEQEMETTIDKLTLLQQAYKTLECHNRSVSQLQIATNNFRKTSEQFNQSLQDKNLELHLQSVDSLIVNLQDLSVIASNHSYCFQNDTFFKNENLIMALDKASVGFFELKNLYSQYKQAFEAQNDEVILQVSTKITEFTIELNINPDPSEMFTTQISQAIKDLIESLENGKNQIKTQREKLAAG